MRDRLLCSGCLIVFLLMALCVITQGAKFVKELRPSALEQKVTEGENIRLTGDVYHIDVREKYQIIYLKNSSVNYHNKSLKESRIIVYDEEKLNIDIGNKIEVNGKVSFYEEERNPGNFNQKLYYQKQNIHASVWASKVKIIDFAINKLKNSLYDFRCRWKSFLLSNMNDEDGAILAAMILAEKSGMDEETKDLYTANGIGHILAISGLHLSIIGVGMYKMLRKFTGSFLIGGIAGILFLMLYIWMIGMSVSVLRALLMFLFRVGADMAGRHYDSPTALAVAAVTTIMWKPLYLYDGGFWLSYGAILAIILILPVFEKFPFQSVWVSVSVNLLTLPILLYYFYEIPTYSVFINLLVVPLMSLVLLGGILGSVCCLFEMTGIIGNLLLGGCSVIFSAYEMLCNLFLQLPMSRMVAGQPQLWEIAVYYMGLIIFIVSWKKKKMKVLGVVVIAAVSVLLLCPVNEEGTLSITMLDVGQGDCIFLKGPEGTTYLIDGGSSDRKNCGQYVIEPFLKSQGVGKIDYVFLTHGDGDHTSGILEMIDRMKYGVSIETIVFPEREVWDENLYELAKKAVEKGIRITTIKEKQQLGEGEFTITCLAPKEDTEYKEGNAGSMILAVRYGAFDMLFTGDVEKEGEEILTESLKEDYADTKWEVLKVAHHGSKNSSSVEFLEVMNPAAALISAGIDNSYGHPHEETIIRLQEKNCSIYTTQDAGAITVFTDGTRMAIKEYLRK